jgi:hypothetical protein
MRLVGEWIELEPPSARVDGELRSMVGGTRGVSLTDASSTTESTWPRRRVSTAAHFKATMRWVPPDLGGSGCSQRWSWTEVEFADEIDMHGG